MNRKGLKIRLKTLKSSLTKIGNFIQEGDPASFTTTNLESKLRQLEMILPKFEEVYFQLVSLEDQRFDNVAERQSIPKSLEPSSEEEGEDYVAFEEKYYTIHGLLSEKVKILKGDEEESDQSLSRNVVNCNHGHDNDYGVKTPYINIGKFDGNSENWLKFYENYRVVIHENPKGGSNLRKFHYLISLLEGEAANLIDDIEVTEDNYEFAWTKLMDFYKNDKKLTETHPGNLFEYKKLDSQSAKGLRELHNSFVKNVNSLKKLGVGNLEDNVFVTYLLASKFDDKTLRTWEENTASFRTMPNYETLEDFIVQQYNYLEAYERKCAESKKPVGRTVKRGTTTLATSTDKSKNCKICGANWHPVYKCQTFLNNSVEGRREVVKKISCCWQCLGFAHQVRECSGRKCSKCAGQHSYLLCTSQGYSIGDSVKAGRGVESSFRPGKTSGQGGTCYPATPQPSRKGSCNCPPNPDPNVNNHSKTDLPTRNSTTCVVTSKNLSTVIFPTCLVKLIDINHRPVVGRFLLDSASELNFITEEFSEHLSLNISRDEINVFGIGNAKTKSRGFISANLKSLVSDYSTQANFYVMPEITHGCLAGQPIPKNAWNIHNHIQLKLADPSFHDCNRKIDGILGVGIFFDIFRKKDFHPKGNSTEPYLHKTALGWVICGEISIRNMDDYFNVVNNRACYFTTANIMGNLEDSHFRNRLSKSQRRILENEKCEEHFLETTKIHSDGRFMVSLPFKRAPESLGNSYDGARKRFHNLEKRFALNSELKNRYSEFIREYFVMGHMELVNEKDIHKWPNYYLPHHPVFKESSTTSLRVVFDASHKTTSGLSLNDNLLPGAALQNDVFDILTAFRFPKFGLTGDVAKMYRQIWINDSDKDFQRILWRENPDERLRHYQLKTVSYGTRSAPFLAIRCLHAIANEIQSDEPEIAEAIKRKFFMDDYLDGADTLEELRYKQTRMETLFQDKGMELRKWCSNSAELMNDLQNDIDEHYCINLSDGDTIKTLGLTWDPKTDDLVIKVHDHNLRKISKRTILGDLHSFWDPIGILSPALVRGRMFLQELWRNSVAWDDDLPPELSNKWVSFRNQLNDMQDLRVSRRVSIDNFVGIELHGFSDASEKAYGACIYIRSWDSDDKFVARLLCSDTHVAPLEQQTLPRLELLAASTSVNLMSRVVKNMKFGDKIPIHYWTDSEIVLTWINGYPQQWKTYVANRVSHIRELSDPIQWHYVCSAENPADVTSRGLPAAEFITKKLWWFGPSWLMENNHEWPIWNGSQHEPIEQRKITYSLVCVAEATINLINRYSSWKKLIHVVAWIFRFRFNVGHSVENRKKGHLTELELLDAKNFIIRTVQAITFPNEISRLTHQQQLGKNSKLLQLNGYMDECGLLRVGGRIGNALIPDNRKFPIILPYKSHLTEIILRQYHENNYHLGPQALLNLVRGEFWPLNGKSAVKAIVHSCVVCRKAAPRPVFPKMAPLPAERVTPARPFDVCGVDYCGPIYVKFGMRKSVKQKAYIAVFVCFTTKAIHLELVTDLSSQAFLAALKRFFARRGTSRRIFSDNGTNFVGAQKELAAFVKDPTIKSECADLGIEWKFIPPGTPHFGGLWEASVKLVKFHLKRTMEKMIMTFEEAYTLLTGIEACLNSRPLTPLSDDPSDPTPLTPAHFLVGGPLNLLSEPDFTQISLTRRWDRVKQYMQQFWQRWSQEYLSSLQQRNKWKFQHDGIPIGTLVAVKDENLKPTEWKMARVTTLHPGKDGINRVATIVFKDGHTTKRPLVKLCPILTCPNNDDNTSGHAN